MCTGSVRQMSRNRDGRGMLEMVINFLGRQRGLRKDAFLEFTTCSIIANKEAAAVLCVFAGAGTDIFATACLTDDLMSRVKAVKACK